MKCPFKLGACKFEGGEECDLECAWLMVIAEERGHKARPVKVCAMTLMQRPSHILGIAHANAIGRRDG